MMMPQHNVAPLRFGAHPPAGSPRGTISTHPAVSAFLAPPTALQRKFETLVMCNFTPRHPNALQKSQWVSYQRLYHLFVPHASVFDVWMTGPGNFKQLLTNWYTFHPTFAGLKVNEWCVRLQEAPSSTSVVFKFCFEHTPG